MLKPKYLEQLPIAMIELYSQAEQDILADMARRISTYDYWIPAADWQYQKLVEMGNFHSYIMEVLSARTGRSRSELERLMEEAGAKTLAFDTAIYKVHGLSPPPLAESEALQAILADGLRNTGGLFDNLTATTADTATRQFETALDRAWLQITSGGFDRNAAIRTAVKDLARDGVRAVTYPSGHTDTIEVAVRRAIVTGVNQSALRLQNALADAMGCDLVETTAHSGARPSHTEWQGRIFSRSGKSKKYPSFVKATGYGTGAGLGGWNCRHGIFPYFEGSPRTYTQKDLDALEEKTVTYNGQELTEYEASQQQRYIERQIRRWKRENLAMQTAGMDTAESAAKIHRWQEAQKSFVRQTGLKRQSDREQIASFGRNEAAGVRATARKVQAAELREKQNLKFIQEDAKIKSASGLPSKVHEPDTTIAHTINVVLPKLNGVVPAGSTAVEVYTMAGDGTSTPIRDLRRLYKTYPEYGDASGWKKKSGTVYAKHHRYVVHWYENDGKVPAQEIKLKGAK